jgi:hypothetical protein
VFRSRFDIESPAKTSISESTLLSPELIALATPFEETATHSSLFLERSAQVVFHAGS